MSAYNQIEITDRDGWRKEFQLQKTITFIGSDTRCDIVLEPHHGGGVALRHLQLLSVSNGSAGYRLVNLGDAAKIRGAAGEQTLTTHGTMEISNNTVVQIGQFTLTFHFAPVKVDAAYAPVGAEGTPVITQPTISAVGATTSAPTEAPKADDATSEKIGAILLLPKTQLALNESLEGSIKVRNRGERPGAQFKIDIEGWPSDAYEIAPGPVLFPNAEKEVLFTLHYPKNKVLAAGQHRLKFRISAPEAYLGEETSVTQLIAIPPQYTHTMRLINPEQK